MTPSRALLLSLALHGAGFGAAALSTTAYAAHVDWDGAQSAAIEMSIAREREPDAVACTPQAPALDQVPVVDDDLGATAEPPPPALPHIEGSFLPVVVLEAPPPRRDFASLAQKVPAEHVADATTCDAPPRAAADTRQPREGASVQPSAIPGHNEPPRYPFVAWRRHIEGTVTVELDIDANGEVTATRLAKSSGCRMLDDAAVQQLRSWKFTPARGVLGPVSCTVRQEVIFRIRT